MSLHKVRIGMVKCKPTFHLAYLASPNNQTGAVLIIIMIVLGLLSVGMTYASMKVKNGILKAQIDDYTNGRDRMAEFLKSAINCEETLRNALSIPATNPVTSCPVGTNVPRLIYFGGLTVDAVSFASGWTANVTCGQRDLQVHIAQVNRNTGSLIPHPVHGTQPLTASVNKISDYAAPTQRSVEICPQFFGQPEKFTYRVYTMTNNTLQRTHYNVCDHSINTLPTTQAEEERGGGACTYPPVRCDGSLGLAHRWYNYPPPPTMDPDDPIKCRLADESWHIGCQLMRMHLTPTLRRVPFPGGWQKFPTYPPVQPVDPSPTPLPPQAVASVLLNSFPPRSFEDDGVDQEFKPWHIYPRSHQTGVCRAICARMDAAFTNARALSCYRNDAVSGTRGPLNLPKNPIGHEYPITDAMGIVPDRTTGEFTCVCFK
jgi:hypothetical protein